jgi:hypothetical protein
VAPADARRPPSRAERSGIAKAVHAALSPAPTRCYRLRIAVSTVDRRYALAEPRWRTGGTCLRYASNGFFVLRHPPRRRWRSVHNGSDPPVCDDRVPRAASVDLLGQCRASELVPPVVPGTTAGTQACGPLERDGSTYDVYIVAGRRATSCARALDVVAAGADAVGWVYFDWRKGGNGPWSDVWLGEHGRAVVAAVLRP